MSPTTAETILLNIQAEATGTQDLEKIKGLMNQLGSEMRGVGQISQQQRQALEQAQAAMNALNGRYAAGSREAQALSAAQAQLRGHLSNSDRAVAQAARETDRLAEAERRAAANAEQAGHAAESAAGGFLKLGGNLLNLNAGLEILKQLGQAALELGKSTVGAAAEYEQSEATFTRMLGSAKAAKQFLGELATFAANTPFELKGLQAQAQMLMNFGFTAKQVVPMLTAIGDSAGGSQEKIDRIVTAIGQMRAKGKVSAEEMMQLAESGVPAWDMLAKAIGTSIPEAMKRAQAGTITAAEGIPALLSQMNTRFGGMMDEQSKTLLGKWSNLKDNLGQTLVGVGNVIISAFHLKELVDMAGDALGQVRVYFQKFDASDLAKNTESAFQAVKSIFLDVRDTAQEVFERSIQPMLERLTPQAQAMADKVQPALARLGAVVVDLGQIGRQAFETVLIPTFQALAPVVMHLVEQAAPLLASLGEVFRDVVALIVDIWQRYGVPLFQAIAPVIKQEIDAAAAVLGPLIEAVRQLVAGVKAIVDGDWKAAWSHLRDAVGEALLGVQEAIKRGLNLGQQMQNLGTELVRKFLAGFLNISAGIENALANGIEKAISNLPDKVKEALAKVGIDLGGIPTAMRADAQKAVDVAGAIAPQRPFGPQIGETGPARYDSGISEYNDEVLKQTLRKTGVHTADAVVDYCAQWVRLTLGKADAKMAPFINKMFSGDRNGNKSQDANDAARNFRDAGLLKQYKGKKDLMPGDTVFYEDGGYGHVGIYIGGGMVRGNNRVTYKQNGGTFDAHGRSTDYSGVHNSVGDVELERLGRVTGYVAAAEIAKRMGQAIRPVVSTAAPAFAKPAPAKPDFSGYGGKDTTSKDNDGLVTAAMIARARELLAALEAAQKAAKAHPGDNKLALVYTAADNALKSWTKTSKAHAEALHTVQATQDQTNRATGNYIPTLQDLKKYGEDALKLFKALEVAQKSGSAAAKADAERNIAAWQGEDKVRKAVFDAESNAYRTRQQNSEKSAKEQRDLRARVADESRQLTVAAAQQEQARLMELDREELARFKGTAAQRLALVRRQADDEYAARVAVARATRDKELRESANKGGPNQAERDSQINTRFTEERTKADDARQDATREAKKGLQEEASSVQGLIKQYNSLRESLLKRGDSGQLTAEDMGRYAEDLADLWASAKKAELSALSEIKKAHQAAKDFAEIAVDHNAAAIVKLAQGGAYDTVADQASRAAAANGKVRASLSDVLAILPNSANLWDDFIAQMEAMDKQGLLSAGVLQGVKDKVQELRDALALEEGERAGAAALQDVLNNPDTAADGGAAGQIQADRQQQKLQSQRETAQGLLKVFMALDAATLHNADTIKMWGDTLKNAAEHEGVTQEQADALAGALDALQQAADLSADDFQTLQGSLRAAMSDGKLTKQEFADLTDQIRLLQDAAKDGVLPKLPEPTSFEEMQRTVAALRESLDADPALISGSTDEIQKQVGVWNEIIDSRVKDHVISVAQGEELKKILGLTVKVGEANREAARAAASDEMAVKPMQEGQDWLDRFAAGKVTTAELRQGLQGVIDDLQVLADTGSESAKQMIEGLKGSIDATKQLDDAIQESKRLQNEQAVESHDFAAQRRYIGEHQQYVIKTAQETFDREKATLTEGTPAYAAAQQRLENARTQAAQEGTKARAQLMLSEIQYYGQLMDMVLGSLGQLTAALASSEEQYDSTGKHLNTPWTDLTANINGAQKAMQTAISMAGDVAKLVASGGADLGAWVSLGTKLVSSIADAIGGFQKAKAEVRKLKAEFAEANPLLNASDYQNAHTRSRGWLADTFGGGPEVVNEIDKIGLKFAQSITKGVEDGITSGIEAAMKSGNITDFTKAMNESLGKSIHESMIEAWKNAPVPGQEPTASTNSFPDFVKRTIGGGVQQQQTTLQKIWADDIKAYTDALKTNDPDKIRAALAKLKEDSVMTAQEAEKLRQQMDDLDRELGTGKYSPEAIAQQQRELAQSRLGIEDQTNELLRTQGLRSTKEYEAEKLRLALERIRLEMEAALAAEGLTDEQKDLIRQQFGLQAQQAQAAYDKQVHDAQVAAEKDVQDKLRSVAENNLEIQHAQGILKTGEYEARKLQLALDRLNAEEKAALENTDLTEAQRLAITQQYESQRGVLSAQAAEAERQRQEQALKNLNDLRLNNAETALGIEEKMATASAVTEGQKWQVQEEFAQRRLQLTLRRLDAEQQAELAAADLTAEMRAEIDRKYALARQSAQADIDAQELQHQQQIAQSWQQSLTGGITALLEGNSPLKALYDGVRSRIAQAIQDGFIAKRLIPKLDPLFDQLNNALDKGLDPNGIIQKIGMALPGLSVEMQTTLGPIFAQLNASIPKLTDAVNGNTAAVKEMQFTQTTVVQSGPSLRLDSPYRAMFARYN